MAAFYCSACSSNTIPSLLLSLFYYYYCIQYLIYYIFRNISFFLFVFFSESVSRYLFFILWLISSRRVPFFFWIYESVVEYIDIHTDMWIIILIDRQYVWQAARIIYLLNDVRKNWTECRLSIRNIMYSKCIMLDTPYGNSLRQNIRIECDNWFLFCFVSISNGTHFLYQHSNNVF